MAQAKAGPKPETLMAAKGRSVVKTPPASGSGVVPAPRSLWEYTIVALGNSLERQMEQLTRMGTLGWELVSIIAPGPPHGGLSLAYLKRPVHGSSRRGPDGAENPGGLPLGGALARG